MTGPVAYLGPPGSFCHQAALRAGLTAEPAGSVTGALAAVRAGELSAALVPFENSAEGSVAGTLDALAAPGTPELRITAEVLLDVHFVLLARPGTQLSQVRTVATHPHAAGQVRGYLTRQLPAAEVVATASTSAAAREVAAGQYDAAVASPAAQQVYGLAVLADELADAPGAVTRFVLVAPAGRPLPAPTGADRTTLVLFETDDHPGALLEMLTEFAVRGVNLTRLESRPTGTGLGRYCFSVDCDGHLAEARVADALTALRRICGQVRFCGSYPKADGQPSAGPARSSDEAYQQAAAWLAGLRAGR